MDPAQLKKIVIPAAAVSVIILLVGGLFLLGEPGSQNASGGTASALTAKKAGSEPRSEGLSNTLPPVDAPDAKTLEGGVKIWDLKVGDGDECKPAAFVSMHYVGWQVDGKEIDCSVRKGDPLNMPLGKLIRGWQIGVPGMKPGGIRRIFIPSDLAYKNSDLVFEMKLLSSK
jgi:FKBP-type peptidyl-prolyl cis-trans isomerase